MTTGAPTADGGTTPVDPCPRGRSAPPAATAPRPPTSGLYDPRFEHDACGVALVADLEGPPVPHAGDAGRQRARAPGPPWGHRERGGLRRRRRHPHPGARRVLPRRSWTSPFPVRGRYATGIAFLSSDESAAAKARERGGPHRRRGGPRGARLARAARRPVDARLDRRVRPAVDAPALRGAGRRDSARARATRPWPSTGWPSSCASGPSTRSTSATSPRCRPGRSPTRGCSPPTSSPSSTPTSTTSGWSAAWPSSTRGSRPTPSRRGRWPTRTATWPTTARSTPWPATGTGCGPGRRCAPPT